MNRAVAFAASLGVALLGVVAGCNEPEQARDRVPAEALQSFDANQPPAFPDAPSYQVREAIRSAALEVRTERALFQATPMDDEEADRHLEARETDMVAIHPAFPFHTVIRLAHDETDAEVEVRVMDGGVHEDPSLRLEPSPIIALSPAAAAALGVEPGDRAPVWVEVVEWAP